MTGRTFLSLNLSVVISVVDVLAGESKSAAGERLRIFSLNPAANFEPSRFHGLSYAFLIEELARMAGDEVPRGKIILAHLGHGASLAAVHDGKPVDTRMGFTSCGGVPMSTRAGDLDPGLMFYLEKTRKLSSDDFFSMVNHESGLLGLSELSSDVRILLDRENADVRAAEALDVFWYAIKKQIGAYAAAMGGLETLVFAGGIGENAPLIRQRICEGMAFLGIEIASSDDSMNAEVISTQKSRVTVRVIRTDVERMIAESVVSIVKRND